MRVIIKTTDTGRTLFMRTVICNPFNGVKDGDYIEIESISYKVIEQELKIKNGEVIKIYSVYEC